MKPGYVIKITISLLISFQSIVAFATVISPFTTDGCSSFPDGTYDQQSLWLSCCVAHDLAYWKGGLYSEKVKADETLHECVSAAGEPEIAELMLAGVKAGGSAYLPTPFRWGYGWPYGRGYKTLSEAEKNQIKKHLQVMESMIQTLKKELSD